MDNQILQSVQHGLNTVGALMVVVAAAFLVAVPVVLALYELASHKRVR